VRFGYSYKSSDGIRQEDVFEAKTKEDVFAALRERGVKPIKVWELHSRFYVPMTTIAIVALSVALFVVCAFVLLQSRRVLVGDSKAMIELRAMTTAITERHRAELVLAGNDEDKIAEIVERTRDDARQVFKDIMMDLSRPDEQLEAKRLYGELMLLTDISSEDQ